MGLASEGEDFSFLTPAEREHLVKRWRLTTLPVTGKQAEKTLTAMEKQQNGEELGNDLQGKGSIKVGFSASLQVCRGMK